MAAPHHEHFERIGRVTNVLSSRLERLNSYHDHKENMAHASLLVNLAFVGALAGTKCADWPPQWSSSLSLYPRLAGAVGALLIWFCIHIYMRWQLRNRRVAAKLASVLTQTLMAWAQKPPSKDDLQPPPPCLGPKKSWACCLLDLIFPCPGTNPEFDDGLRNYPTSVVKMYENPRTKTGAILAEWIVTVGSFLLGAIALARVVC